MTRIAMTGASGRYGRLAADKLIAAISQLAEK
jgi:hypothetical protein